MRTEHELTAGTGKTGVSLGINGDLEESSVGSGDDVLAALELELRRARLGVSTTLRSSALGESDGSEGQEGSGEELHFDLWLVVVVWKECGCLVCLVRSVEFCLA